jgi:twitching motility protein PilT
METHIDELLRLAVDSGGSDVHLKVGSPPVVRVDGQLRRIDSIPALTPADTEAFAESIFTEKAAADFADKGSADFAYGRQDLGRFRVTVFRQRGSVSVVMRRVVPGSKTFAELGVPPAVERLAAATSGIVVVTGPSGSGKTSTISSMLDWINANRSVSILTVEDPIEVLHPDKRAVVVQREVGVDTPNVSAAVRGALRHDSDVIMISEIEDADTARAAVAAAETGHLVITSMRTSDPADTINRLASLFTPSEQAVFRGQLAAQLLAIVSQRLIETKGNTRILACEVLTNNERAQEWIISGSSEASVLIEIIKDSEFSGMQTFDQALLALVTAHQVDIPAVVPYVRNIHELRAKAMAAGIAI